MTSNKIGRKMKHPLGEADPLLPGKHGEDEKTLSPQGRVIIDRTSSSDGSRYVLDSFMLHVVNEDENSSDANVCERPYRAHRLAYSSNGGT